jgi:hypothetical protein
MRFMSTTMHQPTCRMDRRGFIRACANCGQQNQLLYKRLGRAFRCTKC